MQNVVDDVSLRLTAAGLTRTDTMVLLRLDSGAPERKVYTGCVQARAARYRPTDGAGIGHGAAFSLSAVGTERHDNVSWANRKLVERNDPHGLNKL